MAQPRKPKTDAKKPNRSGVALNSYIDPEVRDALDAFIAEFNASNEHPASIRSAIEAALKAYLKTKGHWPPKQKPKAS